MTTTDIMSELYMVHLGLENSFVFNLLFLSLDVFQKRKPQVNWCEGSSQLGSFNLMVDNLERSR